MIVEIKTPEYLSDNKIILEVKDSDGKWEKLIFTSINKVKNYIKDVKNF